MTDQLLQHHGTLRGELLVTVELYWFVCERASRPDPIPNRDNPDNQQPALCHGPADSVPKSPGMTAVRNPPSEQHPPVNLFTLAY